MSRQWALVETNDEDPEYMEVTLLPDGELATLHGWARCAIGDELLGKGSTRRTEHTPEEDQLMLSVAQGLYTTQSWHNHGYHYRLVHPGVYKHQPSQQPYGGGWLGRSATPGIPRDCLLGLHSWVDAVGLLPPTTACTGCGELYGHPG